MNRHDEPTPGAMFRAIHERLDREHPTTEDDMDTEDPALDAYALTDAEWVALQGWGGGLPDGPRRSRGVVDVGVAMQRRRQRLMLFVGVTLVGLGLLLLGICLSLAFANLVNAHEWYSGQVSPTPGPYGHRGCCNMVDCRPLVERETRFNAQEGQMELYVGGQWWVADDPRWFIGPSPDGSWHACMMKVDREPRCTFGGAGS